MISVTQFHATADGFEGRASDALAALSERPGFVRATLGRGTDDPHAWVLVSEWENVGSYRRALGSYDVKLRAAALLGEALDLPSSFESLVQVGPDGEAITQPSDRA
jgi:hypothetical protein